MCVCDGDDRRARMRELERGRANINYPFEEYKLDYVFIWTMVCWRYKQCGNKDFYCNSVVIVDVDMDAMSTTVGPKMSVSVSNFGLL